MENSSEIEAFNENQNIEIPAVKLTAELKDVVWEDSSVVTFISIRHDDIPADIFESGPCGRHFMSDGFLRTGFYIDSSTFYPVIFDPKSRCNYFLVDDFTHVEDTLLQFFCEVNVAVSCSDSREFLVGSTLSRVEIMKFSDSIATKSDKKYATSEWYSKWCSDHPEYADLRTKQKPTKVDKWYN